MLYTNTYRNILPDIPAQLNIPDVVWGASRIIERKFIVTAKTQHKCDISSNIHHITRWMISSSSPTLKRKFSLELRMHRNLCSLNNTLERNTWYVALLSFVKLFNYTLLHEWFPAHNCGQWWGAFELLIVLFVVFWGTCKFQALAIFVRWLKMPRTASRIPAIFLFVETCDICAF